MASIRGNGAYRDDFTRWRLTQRNATNHRLERCAARAPGRSPPHRGSSPRRIPAVYHTACRLRTAGLAPPCLKGRGTQPFSLVAGLERAAAPDDAWSGDAIQRRRRVVTAYPYDDGSRAPVETASSE